MRSNDRRVARTRRRLCAAAVVGCMAALALGAQAQVPAPAQKQITFWDVTLGAHATELPTETFAEFACGTNGGPPASVIRDWTEFAKCPAEKGSGLHEVQFRYDDETEYRVRAASLGQEVPPAYGTLFYVVPVIVSGLFDNDGFLVTLRAVSDPRVSVADRMQAIALRSFLRNRFDPEGWTCVDTPLAEREQAIGNLSFKEACEKPLSDRILHLESNFYRKAGQAGIDPATNLPLAGQFRSDVRLEMTLAQPIENGPARAAAIAATPRPLTEMEQLRRKALNCPGCSLAGVNLKRQDLRGANLAGADLHDADLHAVNLSGADLSGANLSGAIMNRADLRRAKLAGARFDETELHAAQLDGADLTKAQFNKALMGTATFTRANLQGARIVAADLIKARLLDVNLKDAEISDTWLTDSQLSRSDLSGAAINRADLSGAQLANAKLRGTKVDQTDLFGANMRESDLAGAQFVASRLTNVNLTNVNRTGASFENSIDAP